MSRLFTLLTGAGTTGDPAAAVDRGDAPPPAADAAAALAVRLVAPDGDPAGDADPRQRDAAGPEAQAARPRRQAPDRAGPRAARTPPTSRPPTQAAEWIAERDRRGRPVGPHRVDRSNIPTTAHILGGAVIGADPEHGVVDALEPRLRLREPAGLRRRRRAGQPRRQPVTDDHRPRRARDGAGAAVGRRGLVFGRRKRYCPAPAASCP